MYNVREVVKDLYWIGVNDHRTHLFENIHPIPEGVSYNSYVLLDPEKTVLFDTVDWGAAPQFLQNLEHCLNGRPLDYVIINHWEPDHAATFGEVMLRYPNAQVVSTEKGFYFMTQFGYSAENRITVATGDTLTIGSHTFAFVQMPMVHWPEPMATLDTTNGVLFSADAFGSFKALDGHLFDDEVNWDRDYLSEGRRYLVNIVGKYGPYVQAVLKVAGTLPIKVLAPLHGVIWRKDLGYIINKYDLWSRYEPEDNGVMIAYASMYGHTESAAQLLASEIVKRGVTDVTVWDVSATHVSYLISEAFRVGHIILACPTYNLGVYPPMKDFINDMVALNLQKRVIGIMENGTWAPNSATEMKKLIDQMFEMFYLDAEVSFMSELTETTAKDVYALADAVVESVKKHEK
ncbi:MAG: FprA family A-type flavoprotein [Peptoniphilaceae bacterium]|nr:FprA family A-type flavoprotein [Peptoniphilaceae bacterium]MDD7543109.1 FprA family A-type flavoprotein [Peptoniphilaceae bacterium]MDY3075456.1 FprA family A-type flavoprotein [Peptoniphilaceae bacterium]MDY5766687.1 FprA family A-type flavoprotein [Peptoniphilaceae bacterium]